jgi:hypothetical protein
MKSATIPADPEAAGYQLIARLPGQIEGHEDQMWMTHRYADALRQAHALAGLSWHDCRHVASAICLDITTRAEAAAVLTNRARDVAAGTDPGNVTWDNRDAVAQALNIAAAALGL